MIEPTTSKVVQVDDGDLRGRGGKAREAFRTISEVAEEMDLPQHVLRFWESKFSQIRPLKRGGNRRYYRPEDVTLLFAIKKLLHSDGYTIRGVQKLFKEQGVKATVQQTLQDDDLPLDPDEDGATGVEEKAAPAAPAAVARAPQAPQPPVRPVAAAPQATPATVVQLPRGADRAQVKRRLGELLAELRRLRNTLG
ncbi:MerR family transcriptional regulator [Gimibacter soli]|uniref:MerR family transcriptional regulator n=1 Tax=Gimibacter soli TaxID=3024400 RepID=A0AAF0BKH8_9PROT|nr:MerR family transcriptional regulator [Gimibacter soli]WCL52982.1 MerR family transcriptional regulator [Gimibacter soli]